MLVDFYRKIPKLDKKWQERFATFCSRYKSAKLLLIIFGSRGRGDHHLLSDFDIVVITDDEQLTFSVDFPCDLFRFTSDLARAELQQGNTILLDALIEGKVIVDNLTIYKSLKDLALKFTKKAQIFKSPQGWLSYSSKSNK